MYIKGLKTTRNCEQCNLNIIEDVEHVMLFCPKYEENRRIMKNKLQQLGIQQTTLANLLGAANTEEAKKVKITEVVGEYIGKSLRVKEL